MKFYAVVVGVASISELFQCILFKSAKRSNNLKMGIDIFFLFKDALNSVYIWKNPEEI